MKQLYLAAAALNVTPLDWNGIGRNVKKILTTLRSKKTTAPKLVVFPELVLCGPGCGDRFLAESTLTYSLDLLFELLPKTVGLTAVFGLPLKVRGKIYKAVAIVSNGELLGFNCVRKLDNSGVSYDSRWFASWTGVEKSIEIRGKNYPVGREIWTISGVTLGIGRTSGKDLDVELIPSADYYELGRRSVIRQDLSTRSSNIGVPIVYSNLHGNESGTLLYDGAAGIFQSGELLAETARFSVRDTELVAVEVGSNRPKVKNLPHWESSEAILFEEFARAVPAAMFDYLRKSGSRGFTLSLSGGADSGAIAVLIHLMSEFGLTQSTRKEFLDKLDYIPSVKELRTKKGTDALTARELTSSLLTTVYQATSSSGEVTRTAARSIAEAIGARHYEFDINPQVEAYRTLVANAIGRPLTWEQDDLALQNIQARVRAPGVWLLANLTGSLLLTTCNRSESAVGYATMDGDTCGGFGPLEGIDKAFLRRWLVWMETIGPDGSTPIPELGKINAQAPTAELRPGGKQTDESDLMPYPILELLEQAIIRDRLPVGAVLKYVSDRAESKWPGAYSEKELIRFQIRFYQLWTRSQWKRERSAPSVHLDDRDLAPSAWCRFPILSAGFQKEIEELTERLKQL